MRYWGSSGLPIGISDIPVDPTNTDSSTNQTIRDMVRIVTASYRSLPVCQVVHYCLSSLPAKSSRRDVVRSIFQWIKSHVKFVEDETMLAHMLGYQQTDKELLLYPQVVLSMPQPMGDCDDFSMLMASMLRAVGIKCWFVVIAADEMIPGKWSHVYLKCWLEDERNMLSLDPAYGDNIGWAYPGHVYRRMEWFIG
jgi:hypothetical protein